MSKTNPYASKKVRTAEETTEAEEVILVDVPSGSVNNILKWVGDDADKARAAHAVEVSDKKRSSLLSQLKDLF